MRHILWDLLSVKYTGNKKQVKICYRIMTCFCEKEMSCLMTKPASWLCAQRRLSSAWAFCPVWSESLLSAWRNLWSLATRWAHCEDSDQTGPLLSAWRNHGSLATCWAHCEDSDQTGQMPRLIWVLAGRTCHFIGFVVRRLKMKQCDTLHISWCA